MKFKKYLLLILIICVSTSFSATGKVEDEILLYKNVSTNSDILDILSAGTYVKLLRGTDEWTEVNYKGIVGYVKTEYLSMVNTRKIAVEGLNDVRLYKKQNTESEALHIIKTGSKIEIIREIDEFFQIQYDGYSGWVLKKAVLPPEIAEQEPIQDDSTITKSTGLANSQEKNKADEIKSMNLDSTKQKDELEKDTTEQVEPAYDFIDTSMVKETEKADASNDIVSYEDENTELPYNMFPVRKDEQINESRPEDDTDIPRISPTEIFEEGEMPESDFEPRSGYFGTEKNVYADGVASVSVPLDEDGSAIPDYTSPEQYPSNQNYVSQNFRGSQVFEPEIIRPKYSRAYSLFRSHIGVKGIFGSVFSNSYDWGEDDFQDQIVLYGIQAGTRIARSSNGRFGSTMRASFYLSYSGYKAEDTSLDYNINEFYYIYPVSFGMSYDLTNSFTVTGGLGVSAITYIKEYSFTGDDSWQNLINTTYLAPNVYAEINYEITPFILSLGMEYFGWKSDNTEFEIDMLGNETELHGDLKRHLFGGFFGLKIGF